jgi:uncharacterized protein
MVKVTNADMNQRVVVIGATGTIGRPLCEALLSKGYEVVVFSRDPVHARSVVQDASAYVAWSPEDRLSGECTQWLRKADAVIYLAGAPLFNGYPHSRQQIEGESRARASALEALVHSFKSLDRRPAVFIAASSVGIYGYEEPPAKNPTTEAYPIGIDWWGRSSALIERTALTATTLNIRTVLLRMGYVLIPASLVGQVSQFRRHFGGWIGMGRGWTPWIHITDEIGLIIFALQNKEVQGPLNATAPNPVHAREFARALGGTIGRRAWLPVPAFFARMGLGALTDILVKGKPVIPRRALALGYVFQFSTIEGALRDLLADKSGKADGRGVK